MLELDMALESDLGIDSIKRVEILSALQERLPQAPAVRPEHLGTLQTLRQVADFLAGTPADEATAQPAHANGGPQRPFDSVAAPAPARPPQPRSALQRMVVRAVPLDRQAARKPIRLAGGAEVWVSSDDIALSAAVAERLQALGLRARRAPCTEVSGFEPPAVLGGLILMAPAEPVKDDLLRDALRALRRAAPGLRAAGRSGAAVVLTVSRLGGAFGLEGLDIAREPVDGGLAGLAKTARHEWPEVRCKALDLAPDLGVAGAAEAIVEEMLLEGPAEVGLSPKGRCTLTEVAELLAAPTGPVPVGPGDVVVLSGGARGVTAESAVVLARALRPTLVLLGRTPLAECEADWLAPLRTEAEIKRALALRTNGNGSLKEVGERYREVAAGREVRQTLARIEAAGGRAVYRTVDIRDPATVRAALAAVRHDLGPIRGLVHGAGVLADARIEDKTDEQLDHVYGTKVAGLRNLLAALEPEDLRALVLFSSSSGRFGRAGQADYAMANEVLNKRAQQLARQHPGCRVLALNWGPWDGGMVTPGLKKLFDSEAIGLIPPADGGEHLVAELCGAGRDVEVVVMAPGPSARPAPPPLAPAFERTVDLADFPVLADHVLDGRPVVPMALILQWLAHGALHHNPGLLFHGCDDFRILHGVVLDGPAAPVVRVGAGKAVKRDGLFVVPVELGGRRGDGRDVLHARADIVLAADYPPAPAAGPIPDLGSYPAAPAGIYHDWLFHGPLLHAIERVEGCGPGGIVAQVRGAPPPARWVRRPLRQSWLADPLVLDAGFQLVILWGWQHKGAPGLPTFARRYRQFRRTFPAGPMRVVARLTHAAQRHVHADIDYLDGDGRLVARMDGCECVIDASLKRAYARGQRDRV
jgi:NAD(P)-dependent dehydrogenase (short-subunit alcohol dehydrogenase family)